MLLTVFFLLGFAVVQPWSASDFAMKLQRWSRQSPSPLTRRVHRALGPWYVPTIAAMVAINDIGLGNWRDPEGWIIPGLYLTLWFYRERDDDDWKRLLKRFAGRVHNLGHRLTIAPERGAA